MNKVKILWVASNAPYSKAPAAGGQTFNYYFNSFVNDKRFDVRLICWGDINKREIIENENANIVHRVIYTSPSFLDKIRKISNLESSFNLWNKNANLISNYCAKEIIKTALEYKKNGFYPDYIILEWTNTVVLVKELKKIFSNTDFIASEHDVTFVGYERKKDYYSGLSKVYWNQRFKWEKKIELKALEQCALILPQNPDNISLLECEGISCDKMQWLIPYYNDMSSYNRSSNGRDILFFGAMSRKENYLSAIWFIENVMIRLSDLNIRFVVLGSNPPDELKKYESEKIHVTGYVDCIEPFFQESMCMVAPLVLGAGIKVKILEGMSSGIPVITNSIGIEGIPAKKNVEYVFCEKASEYEEAVRMAYLNELEIIGEKGRAFIRKTYNLKMSVEDYKNRLL